MRLLLLNLVTDADSPVQGFTTVWINALARRCEYVDVLTMRAGRIAVAENARVFSVGKERGYSEPRRLLEFYRLLNGLLRERAYDACFAHMNTLFSILAAPLLKPRGIPITLWYAHGAVTPKLRLAEKLADRVVSSSPEGFRLPSRKLTIIGQGIDTEAFTPTSQPAERPFTIVSVSRLAPVKRVEVMVEAARLLAQMPDTPPFRLRVFGTAEPKYAAYQHGLRELVARYHLEALVEFAGPVVYADVPAAYQSADVMVNTSQTGSVDKAVLEAMACGLPVISANEAFQPILREWGDLLLMPPDAPDALAERLRRLMQMPPEARRELGCALREIVVRDHSLEQLVGRLMRMFPATKIQKVSNDAE